MNFLETYSELLKLVENRIREVVPKIEPSRLYEPFEYIMTAGGKRLRPVLTLLAAGSVGGDPKSALDSAIALEVLHNFTLVHDDIMDNSPIRRGRRTVHEKWDSATAILLGDVMVGYAFKLLPDTRMHERADKIREVFTNELIEVCEGQVIDMMFNEKKDVTMMDYLQMIDKKTARLIETSAVIGGHIGLGSKEEIEALKHIARNAGLAFQIQDDLLDMTADQQDFGKKIGKDIIEGKKTYLIITALQRAESTEDKKLLDDFYENNGLPENRVKDMDELFKRNGIYSLAENEIDFFFGTAKKSYPFLKKNQYSEHLIHLIESLNKRSV
ncbi:MAG: polyprenyl synthetase family protein [Candidatus Kapabacteria bacterium]|nr:polyprenyl synthetase family protein [Ignavibacteriota bacterium]MCW5886422.1 polyprenyl synthetase family protein [Candidatus Kapabacteria bacterium]